MTDQQRGGTVLAGSRLKAHTPHLDRFRSQSVTFSEAYCPSPHCCPSRATFFSGLYPSQHGVWNNVDVTNALSTGFDAGVRLWSEDLREAGYRLYFSGKWHLSAVESPPNRGWETKSTAYGEPSPYSSDRGTKPDAVARAWAAYEADPAVPGPGTRGEGEILRPGYGTYTHYGVHPDKFDDQSVIDDARRALGDLAAGPEPWCLYVGTLGPHDPYFVPQEYLDLYPLEATQLPESFADRMNDKPGLYRRTRDRYDQLSEREHREAMRHYLAFCSYQDALFGQLLEALDASGQAENTIVLFCSDHGDYVGDHGLWAKGLPCFKGAYHVPLIIRDPRGKTAAGESLDALVSLADIAPTIKGWTECGHSASLAKGPGRSLVPLMHGSVPADWRDAIFTQSNGNELYGIQRSVMTRDWKLVYNGFDYDEFYDLQADPDEMVNRIDDPGVQGQVDEGMRRIWAFARATKDAIINSYIMVALARVGPGAAFVAGSAEGRTLILGQRGPA